MVKADPKRNYYADLEIPQNACTDDIKKQFRALARLYHPDRNPGKEQEFVPKFQAIQAAHEILSNADERAKYDADRRKLGYSSKPTRPAFPTAHTTAGRPGPAHRPSAFGAQFGTRTAPRPHTSSAEGRDPPTPNAQPPPHPTRPRRPEWHGAYGGRSHQQSNGSNRAQNANPSSAGPTGASRFTYMRPPPPPPRGPIHSTDDPTIKSNVFTAWQHMAPGKSRGTPNTSTPASEDERRPNQGPFGANASTGSPGMRRSNTTKTPRKAGFNPNQPGDFWEPPATRTSSYTTRHSFAAPSEATTTGESSGQSRDEEVPVQKPRERHSDHGLRATASAPQQPLFGERISTPYGHSGGEKLNPNNADMRRSASTRDATRLHPTFVSDQKDSSSGSSPTRDSHRRQSKPVVVDLTTDSSDSDTDPTISMPAGRRIRKPTSRMRGPPDSQGSHTTFTMPPPAANSRSHDSGPERRPSINTEFSSGSETFQGVFKGNGGFTAPQHTATNARHRGPPAGSLPSLNSFKSIFPELPKGATVPKPPVDPAEKSERPVKFDPEEWQRTFKEPSLFVPDPTQLGSSTSRPASSTGRKQNRPRASSKSNEELKSNQAFNQSSNIPSSLNGSKDDGDAMEIDSNPSPLNDDARSSEHRNVRNVTMPTNRPDWQNPFESGSKANPTTIPLPRQGSFPSAVPGAMPPPPPPPPGPPPMASPISPGTTNKQNPQTSTPDEVPPALNLSDLGLNLESRIPSGVADLRDLSSALPFDSKASDRHPSAPPSGPLNIPRPPISPPTPAARRLAQPEWKQYIAHMSVYMGEWYIWDGRIMQHFQTRHNEAAKFGTGPPSTQGTALLEARGDVKDGGIERWLSELEQDRRVRDFWSAACNKHQKTIREFTAIKQRVAKEGFLPA